MYRTLGIVIASMICLGEAWGRDNSKTFRSLPAISNSLVNLGKMDISFHFNSNTPDLLSASNIKSEFSHPLSPYFGNKPDQVEVEPCPCSTLKNFKNPFLSSPTEMLNKILKSNDLFSHNQEQTVSTACCESHEHAQEDTIFFEFNPKMTSEPAGIPASQPIFENFYPKTSITSVSNKPKAIEIFFFPKKKESVSSFFELPTISLGKKKDGLKKSDIQIVGDKELRNDFKSLKYRPNYFVENPKEKTQEKDKIESITTARQDEMEDTTILDTTTLSSPNAL